MTSRGRDLFEKGGKAPIACIEAGDALMETGTYEYSPEYGVAVKAQSLSIHVPDLTNATVKTVFLRQRPGAAASLEPNRLYRQATRTQCRPRWDRPESRKITLR